MKNLLLLLFAIGAALSVVFGYIAEYPSARLDALIALDGRNIIPQELHFTMSGCRGQLWGFRFQGVRLDHERLNHISGVVCVGGIQGARVNLEGT